MIIKNIDDYFNARIQFLHPYLKREEFKRIMEYGFYHFHQLTKAGADVSIRNWRYAAYCGKLFHNIETWAGYMYVKHQIKLRLTYKYTQQEYDGLYYFGLTDAEYKKYLKQLPKGRKHEIKFKNIVLYKIKEEAFLAKSKKHFFMVYFPTDVGWVFKEKERITRNYKEIAYRDINGKIVLK